MGLSQLGRCYKNGQIHTWAGLLAVAEAGRVLGANAQGLCPLLPGHVTRLVGVPDLLAVVAELCLAALPLAGQLGAAGTTVGDHRVPARRERQHKVTKEGCRYNSAKTIFPWPLEPARIDKVC